MNHGHPKLRRVARTLGLFAIVTVIYDPIVQACRLLSIRAQYRPEHADQALAAILEGVA